MQVLPATGSMSFPMARRTPTSPQTEALELLRGARRVLLTGHERPDGDCLGAQVALSRVVRALGGEARVLNPDPHEPQYDYLAEHCDLAAWDGEPLPDNDLCVLLDCGELERTGPLAPLLAAADSPKLVIDHHVPSGREWWDAAYVDATCAATGLLVRRIAAELDVELDAAGAAGVFTSIVTDTGWFRHGNTDAETLRVAGELVERGVRPNELYRAIFQRRSRDHPRDVAQALSAVEYHAGDRLAVADVRDPGDGRVEAMDTADVLDLLRAVQAVEVALLLREVEPGVVKLSARSKTDYDVCALARRFGGGGHVRAAGGRVHGAPEDVKARVVAAALEALGVR